MANIWIDVTNTPHVLFFRPIIKELKGKGHKITITARKHSQTTGMLDFFGTDYTVVGRHAGKSRVLKALSLPFRTLSLVWKMKSRGTDIALCHQSPYAMMAARLLGIRKRIYIFDNETASLQNRLAIPFCTKALCPEAIKSKKLYGKKLTKYPGVKESVYLSDFKPDPKVLQELNLSRGKKTVVMRPEPGKAAYYKKGESVLVPIIKKLPKKWQIVLVCRNPEQKRFYKNIFGNRIIIPEKEIDGPSLIHYSDLVIGAGGTMNREAAVLGTPVISTYRGKLLAVDKWLIEKGLMHHQKQPRLSDIESVMKGKTKKLKSGALKEIIEIILK